MQYLYIQVWIPKSHAYIPKCFHNTFIKEHQLIGIEVIYITHSGISTEQQAISNLWVCINLHFLWKKPILCFQRNTWYKKGVRLLKLRFLVFFFNEKPQKGNSFKLLEIAIFILKLIKYPIHVHLGKARYIWLIVKKCPGPISGLNPLFRS